MDVRHYLAASGIDPIQQWLDGLQDLKARVAILRRIDRLVLDNFGDHKFCGEGVWELRIDVGPGYRVYYAQQNKRIVLLLCGGSKRTQKADIRKAIGYWQDFQKRSV